MCRFKHLMPKHIYTVYIYIEVNGNNTKGCAFIGVTKVLMIDSVNIPIQT
jgi:hypothetical protein